MSAPRMPAFTPPKRRDVREPAVWTVSRRSKMTGSHPTTRLGVAPRGPSYYSDSTSKMQDCLTVIDRSVERMIRGLSYLLPGPIRRPRRDLGELRPPADPNSPSLKGVGSVKRGFVGVWFGFRVWSGRAGLAGREARSVGGVAASSGSGSEVGACRGVPGAVHPFAAGQGRHDVMRPRPGGVNQEKRPRRGRGSGEFRPRAWLRRVVGVMSSGV